MTKKRNCRFGTCGATTDEGVPCGNCAKKNGKCYHHGGATPDGPDSANWVHGIYSQALKRAKRTGLMQAYERALNDNELLSLNDEIALTKARIAELLEDSNPAPDFEDLNKHWKSARDGYQFQHEDKFITHFNALGDAIVAGLAEFERRKELRDESDTLRKLNTAEVQRRTKQAEFIAAEVVVTILARLGVIIDTSDSIEQVRQESLDFIQELIGPHTRADYLTADLREDAARD